MLKMIVVLSTVALLAVPASAQTRERDQIPEKYKWDLAQIYPTDEAWRAAKDAFAKKYPVVETFKGTLGQSPAQMLKAVDTFSELNKELSRLFIYVALKSDQDT